MKVLTLADGSCPSCGARGELALRVWYGKSIQALIPAPVEETNTVSHHACLYLRPFAKRFRAAGRMLAIARATQPFGTTVALHADEELLALKPVQMGPILRAISYIPRLGLLVSLPLVVWNGSILLLQLVMVFVSRGMFRWHRLELVDVSDDRWRSRFRQLAFHSRLIVMDVSSTTAGVLYEAEFIADIELSGRLVLLHDGTPSARRAAEQQVERLQAAGVHVPVVAYGIWRLRRLTRELREVAKRHLEGESMQSDSSDQTDSNRS
jgi:hypothetical protein